MNNLTDRLTTKEAAQILGITDGRVRQMILKGQLPAQRFGRVLAISRGDLEVLQGRQTGRPRKGKSAKIAVSKKRWKPYLKPLDEIIAESGVKPWTDADFERAAAIGAGLFNGFAEQVRKWRDENEILENERWARLGL